jgi:hypothetical protein
MGGKWPARKPMFEWGWFVSYREPGTGRIGFNGRNEWVEQPAVDFYLTYRKITAGH